MIQSNQFLKQAMHSDRKQSCLGVDRSDCKTKGRCSLYTWVSCTPGAGFGEIHCQVLPLVCGD